MHHYHLLVLPLALLLGACGPKANSTTNSEATSSATPPATAKVEPSKIAPAPLPVSYATAVRCSGIAWYLTSVEEVKRAATTLKLAQSVELKAKGVALAFADSHGKTAVRVDRDIGQVFDIEAGTTDATTDATMRSLGLTPPARPKDTPFGSEKTAKLVRELEVICAPAFS